MTATLPQPAPPKQAISGVAPPQLGEVTSMVVWPSLAANWRGRRLGSLYEIQLGRSFLPWGLTLGKFIAFASIPFVLPLIFLPLGADLASGVFRGLGRWSGIGLFGKLADANDGLAALLVGTCQKYRLTNRRVIVEHGLAAGEIRAVSLDRFDSIEIVVLPGQAWYKAGDLVFRLKGVETFRLAGVLRPETFRATCLKACQSYAGVADARRRGLAG